MLVVLLCGGIAADWSYPRLAPTDFAEKAQEFSLALPGTRMELPLHPPGSGPMILIKRAP